MRKLPFLFTIMLTSAIFAGGSPPPINYTDLVYIGPGGVESFTGAVAIAEVADAPYGGENINNQTVLIKITNVGDKSCIIKPFDKKTGSQDSIALFIEGGNPKKIQVDFGKSKGKGIIPYIFVDGKVGKILFKGLEEDVRKIVVNNSGDDKGVIIQNISKKGAGIRSIFTTGKLKRAQSNHGGFGDLLACGNGVIMIGEDSPKCQIKASPKGSINNILICKSVDTNAYAGNAYSEAYNECIASNKIVSTVIVGKIKKINTKAIGPAVIAVDVSSKIKEKQYGKKVTVTEPIVGKDNFVE